MIVRPKMVMQIGLLFALCLSDDGVITLTSPEFRDLVLKRDETTIWLVLFVGLNLKPCIKAEREFRKAAPLVSGLAKFAVVNASEEPFLQRRLGIDYVPLLKVYHAGGVEDYRGKYNVNGFIDCVSNKMPNFVRTFDRKWLDENLPSVVLFTDQIRVPTIWAALSLHYREQFIRFGICSEFHLHKEMSIARLPTIYFYNSSTSIRYRGEMKDADLREAVDRFLNGTLSSEADFDDEGFYRLTEFEEHCRGRDFCVLHTGDDLSEEYRKIRLTCRRHPMKFFYGSSEVPFPQLRLGQYYIWNPRRKAVISVEQISELTGAIDRVIDGGARWLNLDEMDGTIDDDI
jgi:hypothetical protein